MKEDLATLAVGIILAVIVGLIIIAVIVVAFIVLAIVGSRLQKKQDMQWIIRQ